MTHRKNKSQRKATTVVKYGKRYSLGKMYL
jgi:hypothetical protein